jgi:hypothetical protein
MQSLPIHLKIWATGHLNEEVIEVDEARMASRNINPCQPIPLI